MRNNFFTKLVSGTKPYIVAEIGANHNGDIELAKKHIKAALECGADAVKFQSWSEISFISEDELSKSDGNYHDRKEEDESLRSMIKKYSLSKDEHHELREYCKELDITFSSSAFSNEEADLLNELDIPFFKIASMDINNHPLLSYIAKFKKPMMVSTGMASLAEIEDAIRVIERENNTKIIILHCVSLYPPNPLDVNLRNIEMLKDTFGYPIGFSDHTIGTSIPLAAVSLGAKVIEKHFTLNKSLPGWDHAISADPKEMKEIVTGASQITKALGSRQRIVSNKELEMRKSFRRSMVAKRDLPKGHRLTFDDITFKRPGTEIKPTEFSYYIGRELNRDITNGWIIKRDDFKD